MFDSFRVNTHPPTASRRGRQRPVHIRRNTLVLVWFLIAGGTAGASGSANAESDVCHSAELFASDNSDPSGSDELRQFELQADTTLALNGAPVTGSTLLEGMFWSEEMQQVTIERARQFHLCVVDQSTLHAAAEALRRQFDQQAVLTFAYLPQEATAPEAVIVTVPGIDVARFRDAFIADETAHHQLLGGSVTTAERMLILVASKGDLGIARRLVEASGGDWATATIAYGDRELVRQR